MMHLEILTWESMVKLKMRNISKKANRRAKGKKIWDSGPVVHIWKVLFMPDSLGLVWGHSVHFAKFPILQFLKLLSSPNFHLIHPNFIQCYTMYIYHDHTGCHFFGDQPKIMAF